MEYLLGLEGFSARGDNGEGGAKIPAKLLEEVFALNEELDEVRHLRAGGTAPEELTARLDRARAPIEAKQAAHEAELTELSARWDALGTDGGEREAILNALRDCVLERNYITNLLEGIERELNA